MAFDKNDPADLAALKTEMQTDPQGLGYDTPESGNLGNTLEQINLKRPSITVQKPRISSADIRAEVSVEAYGRVIGDPQEWLVWQTGSNGFEEENIPVTPKMRQALAGDPTPSGSIWNTQDRTEMNAAMLALMDVEGSRAEELFGYGTSIGFSDLVAARDS